MKQVNSQSDLISMSSFAARLTLQSDPLSASPGPALVSEAATHACSYHFLEVKILSSNYFLEVKILCK